MRTVILHTDGGARGNPGPAGSGAVLFADDGAVLGETSRYLGHTTNNVAEYEAVRIGLEMVERTFGRAGCSDVAVTVRMDSELVCKQLNGEYRVKDEKLKALFTALRAYYTDVFPHITFEHVRRAQNKHADRLANRAMDEGPRVSSEQ